MSITWKQSEYPGYRVSTCGMVEGTSRWGYKRILKPSVSRNGYLRVSVRINGKTKNKSVHRLVLKTFSTPIDANKSEVNHIDGNKRNNKLSNLEWCTRKENSQHALKMGAVPAGETHALSKLNNDKIIFIKKNYKKFSYSFLAKKYGVTKSAIGCVVKNKSWKHIKIDAEE